MFQSGEADLVDQDELSCRQSPATWRTFLRSYRKEDESFLQLDFPLFGFIALGIKKPRFHAEKRGWVDIIGHLFPLSGWKKILE